MRTSYSNTNYLGGNDCTGALFVIHSDVSRGPLLGKHVTCSLLILLKDPKPKYWASYALDTLYFGSIAVFKKLLESLYD